MVFLISNDPFRAMELQHQLRPIAQQSFDIYLSVEEAEHNLYKLPDLIIMDENLGLSNLLYLTQSIKIYEAKIQVVWLCNKEEKKLQQFYKEQGVAYCIPKNAAMAEQLSKIVNETYSQLSDQNNKKRLKYLKKNLLSAL